MPNFELFIPGRTPSSKNSKVWTGRFLVWSKSSQKYAKDTKEYWKNLAPTFRCEYDKYESLGNLPMPVTFHFVRGTKHKFDYVNPLQTVLDLMVKYEWIPNDDADTIILIFEIYKYDKENPGVYIKFKGY